MTLPKIYAIALPGRYGLTHGLLAWARARLWCEQNNATMLAPFWFKLRVGPYLRRERDKRNYSLLFNNGTAVAGIKRLSVLIFAHKVKVLDAWPATPNTGKATVLLRFHNALKDNEKKSFAQIVGHGPFLRRELLLMTRKRYHPKARTQPFIAIHVRLGDFNTPASVSELSEGLTNTRLPIDWYCDRLAALRAALGMALPTIVFSDGSDADLAGLLSQADVTRAPLQQSVTDLLDMGQGAALIASGSGFSLWGAFLGSVPRIAHPGQSIVPIDLDNTRDIESGLDSELPISFVEHVRRRLDS
jgi:hypothetical protein